jgi:hypothetical protein
MNKTSKQRNHRRSTTNRGASMGLDLDVKEFSFGLSNRVILAFIGLLSTIAAALIALLARWGLSP